MNQTQRIRLVAVLLLVTAIGIAATGRLIAADAAGILQTSGVQGGLIVHVGCGDGRLTGELAANDRYLVHGLDADAVNIATARRHLQQQGLYGQVTVEQWTGNRLPYTENLVNLVVVSGAENKLSEKEIQRVLAPGGVAIRLSSDTRTPTPAILYKKPWPADIDEWSHFMHDATNNAVARDSQVGPPQRLRWTCGPLWSRSHEFNSSLCAMISAGGRIFYMFDEGLTSITDKPIPERWVLTARDAFNGVQLWQKPMPVWGAGAWRTGALRSVPATIPRLMVAEGDRLFVTLGYGEAVSILDAATGDVLDTLAGTEGTQELRCINGVLLVQQGGAAIKAYDTATNKLLWEAAGRIVAKTLAADSQRVVFQDQQTLRCVGLKDGQPRWQAECAANASLLMIHQDLVLLATNSELQAIALDSGETVWTCRAQVRREFFVANDRLWHWQGDGIVGRELGTGEIVEQLDTEDVFTPGHHLRCYESKATENYLITPYRGVEFVSVTGQPNTQHDWMRGACRYGVMPGNGLLYVPPHPCFCYPGVKLTGFNALASRGSEAVEAWVSDSVNRLEKGPAYGDANLQPPVSSLSSSADWPTYRRDGRRTGATSTTVAAEVDTRWQVDLQGDLTPPVVADGRVLVANKDTNTLHAFDIENGAALWQYTADGRIDSPPTLHGPLVLFGGADGRVYCLRATDGELVWRFHAAPAEERIIAFGRLESPWRVHGTVLIEQDVAYFTAGRSSYLDGGIWIYGLNPETGEVLHQTRLNDWNPHRVDAEGKPFVAAYHMEGALSDILTAQDGYLYLGQVKLDRELVQQEVPYILAAEDDKTEALDLSDAPYAQADRKADDDYERVQRNWIENTQKEYVARLRAEHGSYNLGDRDLGLHVFSPAGFLDDTWFNRTFWMYTATWPGFYIAHRAPKTGQLLVVGPETTYAVQAFPLRNLQSPLFKPGDKGYLLLADANSNEPFLDYRTRGTTKGWGFTRQAPPEWYQWWPIRIRAMVLAGDRLFLAGPPDAVDERDPMSAFEGRQGGLLRTCSATDGSTLAEIKLDAPPVFDGLIAAHGRLFLSTTDGRLSCLGGK